MRATLCDMELLLFLGWIVWTVMNAMVASEKGRSVGGVVVASIFLSPLTAYLYLLAVPALAKRVDGGKYECAVCGNPMDPSKPCPACSKKQG